MFQNVQKLYHNILLLQLNSICSLSFEELKLTQCSQAVHLAADLNDSLIVNGQLDRTPHSTDSQYVRLKYITIYWRHTPHFTNS